MTEQEVYQLFVDAGAIIEGHFKYKSGRHGGLYLAKKEIMSKASLPFLARAIIAKLDALNERVLERVDIVAGPHTGGFLLAEYVARELRLHLLYKTGVYKEIPVLGAKNDESLVLDMSSHNLYTSNILLVDDIWTTGSTLIRFRDVLWSENANVLAVGVLWNRGDIKAVDMGVGRIVSLVERKIDSWDDKKCPLCKLGKPLSPKPQ
jgi:orotate phosphoribosyltransferase